MPERMYCVVLLLLLLVLGLGVGEGRERLCSSRLCQLCWCWRLCWISRARARFGSGVVRALLLLDE
jgi:hypothetical protein